MWQVRSNEKPLGWLPSGHLFFVDVVVCTKPGLCGRFSQTASKGVLADPAAFVDTSMNRTGVFATTVWGGLTGNNTAAPATWPAEQCAVRSAIPNAVRG